MTARDQVTCGESATSPSSFFRVDPLHTGERIGLDANSVSEDLQPAPRIMCAHDTVAWKAE